MNFNVVFVCIKQKISGGIVDDLSLTPLLKIALFCYDFTCRSALDFKRSLS